jgi:hypothetical protein
MTSGGQLVGHFRGPFSQVRRSKSLQVKIGVSQGILADIGEFYVSSPNFCSLQRGYDIGAVPFAIPSLATSVDSLTAVAVAARLGMNRGSMSVRPPALVNPEPPFSTLILNDSFQRPAQRLM